MSARLSPTAFKALTSVLRTANNILGGISFVVLAKVRLFLAAPGCSCAARGKRMPFY
jgi:hypothetical protein